MRSEPRLLVLAVGVLCLTVIHDPLPAQVMFQTDYRCEILDMALLGNDGRVDQTQVGQYWREVYVGREFVVDRETGRMTGVVENHNVLADPEVLNHGSAEQAFKVVTVYPGISISYLRIQVFEKGVEKPFLFVQLTEMFTGLCTPL